MMDYRLILPLLLTTQLVDASFSRGFQNFLKLYYGSSTARNLTRADFGEGGSFGGGPSSVYFGLRRDPVIIVHGLNTIASGMVNISNFFEKYGYTQGSVFATTYGPNGTVISGGDTVTCDYLRQIRQLIVAVNKYTLRRVVVAGYSLGSAVARKAILGKICLDNNQSLGLPLTKLVSAYMSVAGANSGATLCQQLPTAPMCNNITGFSTGSLFLKDINSEQCYEGQSRYFIASTGDEVVGYANESIAGANVNITLTGFQHVDQCFNTLHSQLSLAANGYLTQQTLNIDVEAQRKLTGNNCTGTIKQTPTRWNYVNPIDLGRWYNNNNGDPSMGKGSYVQKLNSYVFNSGFAYKFHPGLNSQQFNSKQQVF